MTAVHEPSILSELLALSFDRQHRRQLVIAYILLEAPFLELIFQLFLSVDNVFRNSVVDTMLLRSYVTKKLSSRAIVFISSWRDKSSSTYNFSIFWRRVFHFASLIRDARGACIVSLVFGDVQIYLQVLSTQERDEREKRQERAAHEMMSVGRNRGMPPGCLIA